MYSIYCIIFFCYVNGLMKSILSNRLINALDENFLTDMTIVVNGNEFHVHKIILASMSDYFREMFTSRVVETGQSRIEINDASINPNDFNNMIDYMYTKSQNVDMRLAVLLSRFMVKGFDVPSYIDSLYIPQKASEVLEFFEGLGALVEEIDIDKIDRLMSKTIDGLKNINTSYGKTKNDLVELPDLSALYDDELVMTLMELPSYVVQNVNDTFMMLARMINNGRSPILINLLNYKRLPDELQKTVPPQYINTMIGDLPRISKFPTKEDIIEEEKEKYQRRTVTSDLPGFSLPAYLFPTSAEQIQRRPIQQVYVKRYSENSYWNEKYLRLVINRILGEDEKNTLVELIDSEGMRHIVKLSNDSSNMKKYRVGDVIPIQMVQFDNDEIIMEVA